MSPGGADARTSERLYELKLPAPGKVKARVTAVALLPPTPNEKIRKRHISEKPYWDIERARIESSRRVPVELVVNGQPVEAEVACDDC